MKKRIFFQGLCASTFCMLFIAAAAAPAPAHAAGSDVGQAVSVVPGVFVERDGAKATLALNGTVRDTDRITTDAAGKVRILTFSGTRTQ
jgi:hypothetical protein